MKIGVAYALPDEQVIISLDVPSGTTVNGAIERSKLLQKYPDIDLTKQAVGIFSRKVDLDYVLSEDDRFEIYRPLQIDPKDARMARVKAARKQSRSS